MSAPQGADAAVLPAPDAPARAHSARLAKLIEGRLRERPLPFAEYMDLALYAPGLGYYAAGAAKFGAAGDFVTAPELTPLFGRCVAAQCAEVLAGLGAETASGGEGGSERGVEGGAAADGGRAATGAAESGERARAGDTDGAAAAGPRTGSRTDPTTDPGTDARTDPRGAPGTRSVAASADETPFDGPGILELGAGSGRLAASVLGALETPVPYTILEPSADLRERQRAYLAETLAPPQFARLRWVERLPARFVGVVLANEVMDALPVERFVRRGGRTLQVLTESDGAGGFVDANRPAPEPLAAAVEAIETDLGRRLPEGYASELCPSLGAWIATLADGLERGVVLLADYGYPRRERYLAERTGGTLSCHYRHRAHDDPYLWPGLQDITAHVDFTRAAEAGEAAGLALLGYATQSAFLLGCGLPALVDAEHAALEREPDRVRLAAAVRTLTLPGEMGERFQFVAFGRGYDRALRGFALQDLAHRL